MLTSMTGFGRAERTLPPAGRVAVEIRSVNARFLEVETRLPDGFQAYEEVIRGLVEKKTRRGQIRVSVQIRSSAESALMVFQTEPARRYVKQLSALQKKIGLRGEITLPMVLNLPHVMVAEKSGGITARQWPEVQRAGEQALESMTRMRWREGARLQKTFGRLLRDFKSVTAKVRARVGPAERAMQQRLNGRVRVALERANFSMTAADRTGLLAEAASIVQSSDVTEELARLDSHLIALQKAIEGRLENGLAKQGQGSVGRTIDFLAQELQREVNTLGTKFRDPQVTSWVVGLKGQIEKLKEQAANIE